MKWNVLITLCYSKWRSWTRKTVSLSEPALISLLNQNLYFNKITRCIVCTLRTGKHCCKESNRKWLLSCFQQISVMLVDWPFLGQQPRGRFPVASLSEHYPLLSQGTFPNSKGACCLESLKALSDFGLPDALLPQMFSSHLFFSAIYLERLCRTLIEAFWVHMHWHVWGNWREEED